MRVLLASTITEEESNPFTFLLVRALSQHESVRLVLQGFQLFWYRPFDMDIVHLQQPEALFGYREPTDGDLSRLEQQMATWKQHSAIVATIHNDYPHYKNTARFRQLYDLVYQNVDGVTHRGQTSLDLFTERYPRFREIPQVIIPAGTNDYFENTLSKEEARRALGLAPTDQVIVAFGHVRHYEEIDQIVDGFSQMTTPDRKLLLVTTRLPGGQTLSRWRRKLRYRLDPNILTAYRKIPSEKVQVYLNAADVLAVHRVSIMNSAHLQLGFNFSRVIVGPSTGVVGEILQATGNPVFTPKDPASIAHALEAGLVLARQGYGDKNRRYAEKHWNWDVIGAAHVAFYQAVLAAKAGIKKDSPLEIGQH